MSSKEAHVDVAGRSVRISSPDKVYYPDSDITKLDLASYYAAVADSVFRALAACQLAPDCLELEITEGALIAPGALPILRALNDIATRRGQTLAQMALAWTLRDPRVTSTLIGVSSVRQLDDSLGALENLEFSQDELREIDRYAAEGHINLWAASSAV